MRQGIRPAGSKRPMMSARPPKAPIVMPPPIYLPEGREVGRDAVACPAARPAPRREVITSSNTSSTPCRLQASRKASRKVVSAGDGAGRRLASARRSPPRARRHCRRCRPRPLGSLYVDSTTRDRHVERRRRRGRNTAGCRDRRRRIPSRWASGDRAGGRQRQQVGLGARIAEPQPLDRGETAMIAAASCARRGGAAQRQAVGDRRCSAAAITGSSGRTGRPCAR